MEETNYKISHTKHLLNQLRNSLLLILQSNLHSSMKLLHTGHSLLSAHKKEQLKI